VFFSQAKYINILKLYDRQEIGAMTKEKMQTTMEKYLGQRLGFRRVIDSFVNKLEEGKEEDYLENIDTFIEKVEEKVAILQNINEKILSLTDAADTPEEIVEIEEYTVDVEIKLRKFKKFLQRHTDTLNRETTDTTPHQPASASQPLDAERIYTNASNNKSQPELKISKSSVQCTKLPKLTLPTFDGDLLQSFWDSFESSIHSNSYLTDVQKFGYLKAQFKGSAAMTEEGFALTNANYTRAVDLLRERYGQHCKIIHATMQALLKLPAPTPSVASLRLFYDKMETYIRGLESLGQHQDMYGS